MTGKLRYLLKLRGSEGRLTPTHRHLLAGGEPRRMALLLYDAEIRVNYLVRPPISAFQRAEINSGDESESNETDSDDGFRPLIGVFTSVPSSFGDAGFWAEHVRI